jgi:hypothetical protein
MKKPTRRSIRSGMLALLLLGAMLGALNSSGTFTKLAYAQNYGGGSGNCPAPQGCGNFGCHYNGTNQNVCSLYKLDPNSGYTCPTQLTCS